jgi:hypothetical protein
MEKEMRWGGIDHEHMVFLALGIQRKKKKPGKTGGGEDDDRKPWSGVFDEEKTDGML